MEVNDDSPVVVSDDEEDNNENSTNKLDDSFLNLDIDDDQWFSELSAEEIKYHKKNFLSEKDLDDVTIVCTSCFRQINHKQAASVLRHPHLGVPVCKQCRNFYYDGAWTKDEEGYYEFCRWCANGGDLLCCDSCKNGFCKKCIKRNLGRIKVTEIEESDTWNCFVCHPKQIWKQRSMFYSLWSYQKTIIEDKDYIVEIKPKHVKKTFIDDVFKGGLDVNKIFGEYLAKAQASWRKKANDGKDADFVKMVKKIRTIIQISQHNLKLLDENILIGYRSELPHLNEDLVSVAAIPEAEDESNQQTSQEPESQSPPRTNGHDHDQSRDIFDDSYNDNRDSTELPENQDSIIDENKRAREAVLQSTSSELDYLARNQEQESSPRKKLKTKKELNELRRKSHLDEENGSEDETEEEDYSDSSPDLSTKLDESVPAKSKNKPIQKEYKKEIKRSWKKLNMIASKIDVDENKQIRMNSRIDIRNLSKDIRELLQSKERVSIPDHQSLMEACSESAEDSDRDIDRLCNLKSLNKSRRGSSEYDSKTKDKVKNLLKKKDKELGLGDISSDSHSSDQDQEQEKSSDDDKFQGFKTENDLAKNAVLAQTSDENSDEDLGGDESENSEEITKNRPTEKIVKSLTEVSGDKEKPKKKKQLALLTMKLSESDSSEEEAKYREKMEKKANCNLNRGLDSGDTPDTDQEPVKNIKKKSKLKRAVVSSESENGFDVSSESNGEEGSDYEEEDAESDHSKSKKTKRKKRVSSSDDNSDSDDKPKKRRRIKGGNSDSDANDDEEASPSKGRHDIRKIIKDKNLAVSTKEAAAEERERRKRIEERQSLYNKQFKLPEADKEGSSDQLVLDFNPETMEVLVEVHKRLVKKLKPHQINGVKFMWDACFESLEQIQSGKRPGGAILAHCMGLGKTLQTITLTHTVLSNPGIGVNRVMVICPVNTVKNWHEEYDKWLTGDLELDVYEMSKEKDNWGRADRVNQWFREGGVLIIGYEMFRNLVNEKNNKFKKKQREIFNKCLLDPGPDLVVCDEGHLLKNEKSAINKAVNRISTGRRIVLTGTPLQNNLKEYFEMVNFVKPMLMGTRKEFSNRFVNPIVNGQHADSTERDVRVMKKRSFILNDLLKGCMQRLDYNVLVPYLQPKHEYVLSISMTDLQKKLYKYYLENFAKAGQISDEGKLEGGKKGGLFYDVQQLSRIWNHPFILELAKQRKDEKDDKDDDEEGSLKDFINDDDEEESDSGNDEDSDNDSDIQEVDSNGDVLEKKSITRSSTEGNTNNKSWWNNFMSETDQLDDIHFGNKMVLLMDILKECALIGDKVLVFSQSLLSLDLIEEFLARVNEAHESSNSSGNSSMTEYLDSWLPGKDYYRMDGSTAPDTRKVWCKYFNKATNYRMRLFLISTKAGGLGINLVAANRVIVFDASWNPSHDIQSIFRVFRFGQTKPVYIYRFLGKGTMEEKIYERQVTKQSLSARVVDEQQIERHFTMNELSELYEFKDEPMSERPIPVVPEDRLLAELLEKHKTVIWSVNNHDSLLENQVDQNLTEDERKSAWEEYEQEKKGVIQTNVGIENTQQFGDMLRGMLPRSGDGRIMASPINPMAIQAQLRQMNPELAHEELVSRTRAAILQLQNLHRVQTPVILNESTLSVGQRNTTGYDQSYYQAEMAKAKAMINRQYPGMYRFGFRGPTPGVSGRPGPSDVITLDGPPEPPMMRMPIRAPVPAPRGGGGARGRGGRRGRPRLDPDTDLDFSPEPSSTSSAMLLARLQQAGLNVNNSDSKSGSGNES